MSRKEPLFYKYDFGDAVRNAPEELSKRVDQLSDDELFVPDQAALIANLVARSMIRVPELNFDGIEADQREVDIDVSGDPRRFLDDRSRPFYVKATEISFRVPYKGDRDVFFCRPSSYSLNPPRADIESDAVVVRVVREDQNAIEYRKVFDRIIADIQECLAQLRRDCQGLELSLQQAAAARIGTRREKRNKDRTLLDGLGLGKPK